MFLQVDCTRLSQRSGHTRDRINNPGMDKQAYVYMLTDRCYGTLYVGVTSDLIKRVWQHREACVDSFTKRYGLHQLVWYEVHEEILEAIAREKRIKKWMRAWKIELIQQMNPTWRDLYLELTA